MEIENEIDEVGTPRVWTFMAGGLAIASLLWIASAIADVFGFTGTPTRGRLYAIAEQASVLPPILAVGAAAMTRARKRTRSWPLTVAGIAAVMVVVASTYGLSYVLFTHHREPRPDSNISYFAFATENWGYRMSGALRFLAAGLLAVGVLALSRRARNTTALATD